jgi:adenylosuccinate synthase
MARRGIKVVDLLHPSTFREKLSVNLPDINFLLEKRYRVSGFKIEDICRAYMGYAKKLAAHIADTDIIINEMISQKRNVLFEGAQGTLLDIDHGTYPYVTSSNSVAGGACTGLGIGPTKISKVLGIVKAYTTRVGSGPFPTEIKGALGEEIREKGGEYGATTGRPRRCGWLDIVVLRHAARINGLTGVAITKLDVLDGIKTLKICTSYKHKGKTYKEFPKEIGIIEGCTPLYEEVKGWSASTVGITDFGKLPHAAKAYIRKIQSLLGVEIQLISTGQKRDEIIQIKNPF